MKFKTRVVRKTENDDGLDVCLRIGGNEHVIDLRNLSREDFDSFEMGTTYYTVTIEKEKRMCQLNPEDVKAMSNRELAAFIKEHKAKAACPYQEHPDYKTQGKADRDRATHHARTQLQDFIRHEAAKGACDHIAFEKTKDQDGFDIITSKTYVVPPMVMEDIIRRLAQEPKTPTIERINT